MIIKCYKNPNKPIPNRVYSNTIVSRYFTILKNIFIVARRRKQKHRRFYEKLLTFNFMELEKDRIKIRQNNIKYEKQIE